MTGSRILHLQTQAAMARRLAVTVTDTVTIDRLNAYARECDTARDVLEGVVPGIDVIP